MAQHFFVKVRSFASRLDCFRNILWLTRAVQVRLRFLIVIVIAFLVVGKWDVIRTHWDRWTSPSPRDAMVGVVADNTEFFCPMDPGVLSMWPGKCSICNMALVKRVKGDMSPLPNGVVARVQFSPERIMLAGIRTSPIEFLPLSRTIELAGVLEDESGTKTLSQNVAADAASVMRPGLTADLFDGISELSSSATAKVRDVNGSITGPSRVTLVLPNGSSYRAGQTVIARIRVPLADTEPFRSLPSGKPAPRKDEPRVAFVCPDHPDVIRTAAALCPKGKDALERVSLAENQRLDWWCPMHPTVIADHAGQTCGECGGMELIPRIVTYRPTGEVLAIPETAVIDTGLHQVVFVETMPGVFDGVEVRLGPRSEGSYSVISGLSQGQRIASAGAFLIDAETRLNPSLAAGYFGAKRTSVEPSTPATVSGPKSLDFSGLSPVDRSAVLVQRTCPVTGKLLGSMGSPPRSLLRGRTVFLCCEGCEDALRDKPDKYWSKLPPMSKAQP
ncbi:MAG: hypothetical protein JWN86_4648 [Planctomycetota bacterium]|nr:hypothetical protein [Planctomycetota bacterium]